MKRVLLYEPSGTFAQFMTYLLERLGYQVSHVDNADQVLNEITATMPDMIIAEAHLKEFSGIELCCRLKGERMLAGIPVAIVSVDGSIEARLDAHKAGCVDYLTKPLTARSIHELMERHLPYHYKRHNLRAKMHVNAHISDGSSSATMKTLSIGEGGMYACTDQPFKVGTILDISLPLPSLRSPIQLKGEVIYTTNGIQPELPKGMGVKFIGMDSNTVTLLRHYMESYLHDYVPESFPGELG